MLHRVDWVRIGPNAQDSGSQSEKGRGIERFIFDTIKSRFKAITGRKLYFW